MRERDQGKRDWRGRRTKGKRERTLWPPPAQKTRQREKLNVLQFIEDGVPGVGANGKLRVIWRMTE